MSCQQNGIKYSISIKGREHKICLYADNVLVTLSEPDLSLPKLMSSLEQYGLYSGYKLNLRTKPFLITFSHKIMLIKYIISNGKQML
jgi:hypothetical protein